MSGIGLHLLAWIPAAPLAGALLLMASRGRMSERLATLVGVGSIGIAALLTALVGWQFLQAPPVDGHYTQVLWTWLSVEGLTPQISFRLDGLSLVMMGVITGVGFLIHWFASAYMHDDEGFARFFAYMNLFVANMLVLVLADNLLLLYLGWEGVGLCSYLLIGFWYRDPANGLAARKAFIVTRVGDTLMAIGLFILATRLGTLDIQQLMTLAREQWPVGSTLATVTALLLLGGAVGKSAQLPLQTWLPDAMAGPTPVSALIHAATMVTAGVYLIARTHGLFELSPFALEAVGWVGGLTLLLAGFTALTQTDIKRILAYSTMSQIGYMFLALGVGAWSAAIFHLMTHAFFKALLFLSAGAVILCMHHEQDIFRMGGLRRRLPLSFWSFVIGGSALAALPLVTAGFYSKDAILWGAWATGHQALAVIGLFGAFLTSIYTFRLIFIAFFGIPRSETSATAHEKFGLNVWVPLIVLGALSVVGGFIALPLDDVLPRLIAAGGHEKHTLEIVSGAIAVTGIALAWLLFLRRPQLAASLTDFRLGLALRRYWQAAWGFDWLYERLFVRPFLWLVQVNRRDEVDTMYTGIAHANRLAWQGLSRTQTGQIRWYAAGIAAGTIVIVAMAVWL
jgi:NADH-quinone oxidoreductase subunit L